MNAAQLLLVSIVTFKFVHCQVVDFFSIRNRFQPKFQDSPQYSYLRDDNIKKLGEGFLQNLVHLSALSKTGEFDIQDRCLNDTEKLISDITHKNLYAIQFLDADGKLPPGVFQGGRYWVGDYQQCNSIKSDFNIYTAHSFKGKYFTAALSGITGELQELLIGICLPDSCNKDDVKAIADTVLSSLGASQLNVGFVVEDHDTDFDGVAITAFVITGIIGVLIILGTLSDLLAQILTRKIVFMNGTSKKHGLLNDEPNEHTSLLASGVVIQDSNVTSKIDKVKDFLACFSFVTNTKKLLNTSTATGPLTCLNGLRVISMWWVIQGHTYEFSQLIANNPIYAANTIIRRFTFQAIENGTFSVDTFFFLSGLLVAYLAIKEFNEKGKMNWIYYFCHRYWRITPLYAYLLLICIVLFTYMPAGPFQWLISNPHGSLYHSVQSCRNDWWANLIYINNFYPNYGDTSECFAWAWYLANDMQFYIFISPILILLYKYRKTAGVTVGVSFVLACVAIRAILVSYYGLHGFGAPTKHTDDPWGKHGALYVRPWARMSPYIVGILTGFVLHHKNCRIKMNMLTVVVGWCLATGSALAVIYGLYYYSHNGVPMSLLASGFYVSLSRTVWSLSLTWLVIACASGYGGPVNFVLSWKLWAPLGRLTFAAYLVHPMVLITYQATLMTPLHFTDLTLIYMFVSNVVFSYLFAYVLSMAVEAPMMGLEKLLLHNRRK